MLKNKMKKMVCVAVAAMSLTCTGATAFASTIPFNVTVGGTGTQDPLSMKELKNSDGDQYAYFTGLSFSKANTGIYVRSYKKSDTSLRSDQAYLSSSNAGNTQKRVYNKTADGGVYYYMKAEAVSSRVNVKGNYCP